MRIDTDPKLDFSDVLIRPKRSTLLSRKDVDLTKTYTFCNSKQTYRGIPVIAANMDHCGTIEMANALAPHRLSVALHKHYSAKELSQFFEPQITRTMHWYSMGITTADVKKFEQVIHNHDMENYPPMVCVDVANGYSEAFADFVRQLREKAPTATIMAGNVVTGEMVEQLILSGADIVKVGIGPGSVCTTRKMTGVGYPQLSAVIECADAAHGLGGHVCSDGGCTTPGDVAKAFGAGADFVMLGGMFAGHDECAGEILTSDSNNTIRREDISNIYDDLDSAKNDLYMKFYGMSSKAAMEKHNGGVAEYRASEGKEVRVPYRGPVKNTIRDILGGVRSACTYTGSQNLKELPKRTTFVLVHNTHNKIFGE